MYEAIGTVRSEVASVLAAQAGGTVREVKVNAGDRVHSGQVLAIIDDRGPRAQLAAAEAGLEAASQAASASQQELQAAGAERKLAEATFARYRDLLAKNSVTRQEFDEAEARYQAATAREASLVAQKHGLEAQQRQAAAQADSARTLLSHATVVSPLDGIVTARSVDPGTVVLPGAPLLTVEDPAHYRLEVSLPEGLLAKVRAGEAVAVTIGHGSIEGRVREIVPAADAATRTVLVKINLPVNYACRSGEYGKAAFRVGEATRIILPQAAVIERGELEGVFTLNPQGIVEFRLIKTGKRAGDRVEVLSGVAEGDRIATGRLDDLKDGVRVEAP
jgi:multidrug efflux pump subunit AcrA (membrane-fusion protein)